MTSRVVLALVLATLLSAGMALAAPGDPFGGDDPGCFPISKDAKKCQDKVAKAATKAFRCIISCHLRRANGHFIDDTAEDSCETGDPMKSCLAKYDAATGPASKINALCPPCLSVAARASIFTTIEGELDGATNAAIYCAPGNPFGGDDMGNVPTPKSNDKKCEDAVAKAVSKAAGCINYCDRKRAAGKLADDTAEDACESGPIKSCKVKYDGATGPASKINALCPACLDATARGNLFTSTETAIDAIGGSAYCCEPTTTTTTSTSTTTTSTSTTTSTTSTTCPPGPPASPTVLKGSLTATFGRFNYNLTNGLPAANSACNTHFPGTHACTYSNLQAAEAACDLPSLTDTSSMTVTAFWAIDSTQPPLSQCQDDVVSFQNWEYATAHTGSRGNWVALNNTTGVLGPLQTGQQCNQAQKWVGCCQ